LGTLARNDYFAVFAAFQGRFQAVEAQPAFMPLFAMAADAGGFEDGADVFGVSDAFLFGGGRQFAEVDIVGEPR
jgi:hypothetical protein